MRLFTITFLALLMLTAIVQAQQLSDAETLKRQAQAGSGKALATLRYKGEKGDAEAQEKLGEYYRANPHGLPNDLGEAEKWYRLAAGQGRPKSELYIGEMYDIQQDEAEAFKWFHKAAEQGEPHVSMQDVRQWLGRKKGLGRDLFLVFRYVQNL